MIFSTPTQFAALALMLVIGWLFGFASHPGGKKWKRAYRDEQSARTREVAERDATIRELETRHAALTKDFDKPRAVEATTTPMATATAVPARKRGWFDWGSGDDLTRLRGIDGELARLFKDEGVTRYSDLANLSDQDELALERRIDLPAGYIARERLREQARLLADGQADAHARTFG